MAVSEERSGQRRDGVPRRASRWVYHRFWGSGGVPVGPPVFKTGDAALGVAWWVRLPCAPAIRHKENT